MRYDAFISYSHALDGRLAPALQRGLQRFAKRWHEMRALRVFRDETSLAANPRLWGSIVEALEASSHFILLASPRAARSPWVEREVAWWLENKPQERLLIALTEGELAWDAAAGAFRPSDGLALPPILAAVCREEPRYIDLRWAREPGTDLSLQHNRFREAVADLAAVLHDRPKDELIGEEVRQHRRVRRLTHAAVVSLALFGCLASGAAWWALEQQREAERQQAVAERQTELAERQTAAAEENFTLALDAADAMVTEVAGVLVDLKGVPKERIADVLEEAETLFGALAERGGETRPLLDRQAGLLLAFSRSAMELGDGQESLRRARLAMAHLERALALPGEPADAEIQARRASGLFLVGLGQQELEGTEAALATFEQALALYASLVAAEPDRAAWIAEYAEAHYYVAVIRFQQGDLAGAMEIGEAGMVLMRRAVELEPDNRRWLRDLAVGNSQLALGYRFQGRLAEARAACLEAAEALRRLLADAPYDKDLETALAHALITLAQIEEQRGDYAAAAVYAEEAVILLAGLARVDPSDVAVATGYGSAVQSLGLLLERQGDFAGAAAAYAAALETFEAVLKRSPDRGVILQLSILASANLARLAEDSAPEAALESYRAGLETLEALLRQEPDNRLLQLYAAALASGLSVVAGNLGLTEEALAAGTEALALGKALVAADPSNVEYRSSLNSTRITFGWTQMTLERADLALASFRQALRTAVEELKRAPDSQDWLDAFRSASSGEVAALRALARHEEADEKERSALAFLSSVRGEQPDNLALHRAEISQLIGRGWVAEDRGEKATARELFLQARELASGLVARAPEIADHHALLAEAEGALALSAWLAGKAAEAAEGYRASIDAWKAALDLLPSRDDWRESLATSFAFLGWSNYYLGKVEEADAAFQESQEVLLRLLRKDRNAERLEWLAFARRGASYLHQDYGDPATALAAIEAAAETMRELLLLDPDDGFAARDLAGQLADAAAIAIASGDHDAAAAYVAEASETLAPLLTAHPPSLEVLAIRGNLLRSEGSILVARGAPVAARDALSAAAAVAEELTRRQPDGEPAWELRVVALAELARVEVELGELAAAFATFERSLAASARYLVSWPDDLDMPPFALQIRRYMAQILVLQGEMAQGAELAAEALRDGERLAAAGYPLGDELTYLRQVIDVAGQQANP